MKELVFDCIIYDKYKDLLKKSVYEPIILKLMNESEIIFTEKYKYIRDQSHNESDFVSDSGVCYDAKLLFYESQCQALAVNKDNLYTFFMGLENSISEIYKAIKDKDIEEIVNSVFYKEMVDRIKRANYRENIILFIPFSCTFEVSNDLETLLRKDIFINIFSVLKEREKELVFGHNIYIIYPNVENYIIIKKLNDDTMEFIMDSVFDEYISFEVIK